MATLKGYDISHHNYYNIQRSGMNLSKIAEKGFIIMKTSEGVTWRDPCFQQYLHKIGNITDKQIGFYHYAHAEYNDPTDEADAFIEVIKPYIGKAVFALDVEQRSLALGSKLGAWCRTWLDVVYESTGVKPLIYIQKSALKFVPEVAAGDYGLWLPAWQTKKPRNCEPFKFIAIWQHDATDIDKNIFYGSAAQWRKYAAPWS